GTLACAPAETGYRQFHRMTLWRANDSKHGCDVTITYHGTEECSARLEYRTAHDRPIPFEPGYTLTNQPYWGTNYLTMTNYGFFPPRPRETTHAGTTNLTVTLQNVTDVWLICGDVLHPHNGECSYSVDEIDCSRDADQIYPV